MMLVRNRMRRTRRVVDVIEADVEGVTSWRNESRVVNTSWMSRLK